MSKTQRTLALSLPILLCGGCDAVFFGNLGVLGMTIGIFLGTLFLDSGEPSSSSSLSAQTTSRS
jgi:hypothetical protein